MKFYKKIEKIASSNIVAVVFRSQYSQHDSLPRFPKELVNVPIPWEVAKAYLDYIEEQNSDHYDVVFWSDDQVFYIEDYDNWHSLKALPRNPSPLASA